MHGLDVVGVAADPFVARDLIVSLAPDVLTLDIEMPRMNGLTFLERLMAFKPLPVVVLSSLAPEGSAPALRALELGAIEVLAKPAHDLSTGLGNDEMAWIASVVRTAAGVKVLPRWTQGLKNRVQKPEKCEGVPARRILALGSSTGGTLALPLLLEKLPADIAGCVLVQHMPNGFTAGFAKHLDQVSPWRVREAQGGELVRVGEILLAPGGRHMALESDPQGLRTVLKDGPAVSFVKPSVDVLFLSCAQRIGPSAAAAVLTGMGRDGAAGMLAMRKAGARTLAQDEASSVVFGMPKEAWRLGAAEALVPLDRMADRLYRLLTALPPLPPFR
jgi:two-component system chemotaxis response regulator CheB